MNPRYLSDMLNAWADEVNEKGYFGHIYTDGISEQQLSSHGWVLQALSELHRAQKTGIHWAQGWDAKALAMPSLRTYSYQQPAYEAYSIEPEERESERVFGSHLKQIGPWILSTDVGCFTIGMTGLIDACKRLI